MIACWQCGHTVCTGEVWNISPCSTVTVVAAPGGARTVAVWPPMWTKWLGPGPICPGIAWGKWPGGGWKWPPVQREITLTKLYSISSHAHIDLYWYGGTYDCVFSKRHSCFHYQKLWMGKCRALNFSAIFCLAACNPFSNKAGFFVVKKTIIITLCALCRGGNIQYRSVCRFINAAASQVNIPFAGRVKAVTPDALVNNPAYI